jgi:hypothetical protein
MNFQGLTGVIDGEKLTLRRQRERITGQDEGSAKIGR